MYRTTNVSNILFIIFLFIATTTFSQSKKEIIIQQTFQIDSLSKINRLKSDSLKTNRAFIEVSTKSLDQCKLENNSIVDSIKQLNGNILELNNKKKQLEKDVKALENSFILAKKTSDSLVLINQQLSASLNAIQFKTVCHQEEKINPNSLNPVKTKTCESNFILTILKSELDFGGKNHQNYELFIKRSNAFQKVKNEELFNDLKTELLEQINAQLEYTFNSTKKEHAQCLNEIFFTPITFDQLGISITEKTIEFHYDYGYSKTCMKSFGTLLEFPLPEIEKYFIKFE